VANTASATTAPTTQASVPPPVTSSPTAAPANPFAALGGGGGMNPWAMGGGMGATGMGGAAPDQNMMNQMLQNPMIAQYMSTMLQNPAVLDSIISTNPHLSSMGPEIRQMMQSPEFRQMISNPDTIRQMAQMSSAMQGMGMPPGGFGSPFGGMGSPNQSTTEQQGTAAPPFNPFAAFGNPMLQQNTSAPADNRPPEERFQVQLQQLNEMGLWDAAKNIRALQATNGDVNAAIEILFSGGNV
jgi:ubiquilin